MQVLITELSLSAQLETIEVEFRKVGEVLTGNADDNTEPSR